MKAQPNTIRIYISSPLILFGLYDCQHIQYRNPQSILITMEYNDGGPTIYRITGCSSTTKAEVAFTEESAGLKFLDQLMAKEKYGKMLNGYEMDVTLQGVSIGCQQFSHAQVEQIMKFSAARKRSSHKIGESNLLFGPDKGEDMAAGDIYIDGSEYLDAKTLRDANAFRRAALARLQKKFK